MIDALGTVMKDKISQLVDHEPDAAERRRILDQMSGSREAVETWERYHVIRSVVRNEIQWTLSPGFAERVRAAVAAETISASPSPVSRYAGAMTRLALAAAVAGIAVFGIREMAPRQSLTQTASISARPPVVASAAPAIPVGGAMEDAGLQDTEHWNHLDPQAQRRLNRLLLEHNQFTPDAGADGLIGYVRIVGYDRSQPVPAKK